MCLAICARPGLLEVVRLKKNTPPVEMLVAVDGKVAQSTTALSLAIF